MSSSINLKLAGSFSVLLRGLMLVAKFLFMLALARYTTSATVGIYALVVTTFTMLVYLIGAELHQYTTREVVNSDKGVDRDMHIQNHGRFVLVAFLLSLPLAWLILDLLNIRQQVSIILLTLVLFGEVLCQELGRYLLVLGRPVISNLLQLLRSAAWMPFAILLLDNDGLQVLNMVLAFWGGGCLLASFLGLWHLRASLRTLSPFSWVWLRHAFSKSRHYFAVALLTHIYAYADRFIVQFYLGESQVGLLAFYQSFANTVQTFAQTGVISILMPSLLIAMQRHDWPGEREISKRMLLTSLGVAAVISLALLFCMPTVLKFVGNPEYVALIGLFPWLLLGNLLIVAGLIPHLRLYALHRDSLLMRIFLFVVPIAVLANLLLVPRFGFHGVVAVFVGTAALQAALNFYFAKVAAEQNK
jgi:O-antigen/teichoic acid export membrane protein